MFNNCCCGFFFFLVGEEVVKLWGESCPPRMSSESGQLKTCPHNIDLSASFHTGQIGTVLWGRGFLRAPFFSLSGCWADSFHSYHSCKAVFFKGEHKTENRRMELLQVKMLQSLLFFQYLAIYFS